jgi:UDP-3-O-[3-hydroxymyristoyl] glucosamine N-acyltransferase
VTDHDQCDDEQVSVAGAVGRPPAIHPTAVVEAGARIADDVTVGAYCVISSGATIGRGSVRFHFFHCRYGLL